MTKSFIKRFIQKKVDSGEKNYFKVPETDCKVMVIDAILYTRVFVTDDLDNYFSYNSIDAAVDYLYNKYVDIAIDRELNR